MKLSHFSLLLLLAVLSTACVDRDLPEPGSNPDAILSDWSIVRYVSEDKTETVPENLSYMEMSFSADALLLTSSCNTGNATYTVDNLGKISFGPMALTKRACVDEDQTKWEDRIVRMLSEATQYGFGDGHLYLWNEAEERLILEPK